MKITFQTKHFSSGLVHPILGLRSTCLAHSHLLTRYPTLALSLSALLPRYLYFSLLENDDWNYSWDSQRKKKNDDEENALNSIHCLKIWDGRQWNNTEEPKTEWVSVRNWINRKNVKVLHCFYYAHCTIMEIRFELIQAEMGNLKLIKQYTTKWNEI